jgi:hypothetical protein
MWGNFLLILFVIVLLIILVRRHAHNKVRAARLKSLEEAWIPQILAVLGGEKEASVVHAMVEARDEFFFLEVLLGFLNVTEEELQANLKDLAEPYLAKVAKRFDDLSTPERAIAVLVLTRFGGAPYLDQIERALDDPSPLVAMVAARYFCQTEGPEFTPRFLKHADRFRTWNVNLLGSMLAEIGQGAMADLTDTLVDPQASDRMRAVAAHAISIIDPVEGALAADRVLEEEEASEKPSVELVAACLRTIQAACSPSHLARIRRLCESPEFVIRVRAIDALRDLAREDQDFELLERLLADENYWVALRAAEALAELGRIEVLERLASQEDVRETLVQEVIEQAELKEQVAKDRAELEERAKKKTGGEG